jgi:hypothetical protein
MKNSVISNLKFALRGFVSTLMLVLQIAKVKLTGRQSNNSHTYLLESFYLLGGSLNLIAAKVLGKRMLEIPNNGLLGKYSSAELDRAASKLKSEGYFVFESVISPEMCQTILEESGKIPGKTRIMDNGNGVVEEKFFNRSAPTSVRFDYSGSNLISNKTLQRIVFDESILSFAQRYLGVAPILDLVGMWWHTTYAKSPDKQAAQWFHFDMDHLKWIKFFFYITDVDENTGPHTFVARSHKGFGIPFKLRSKGYVRLTDEEVAASYTAELFKEFIGKRGTLIVEDTRGLHKGKHCISGDRLLFQLEFTASTFGVPIEPFLMSGASSEAQVLLQKYPHIYQAVQFVE